MGLSLIQRGLLGLALLTAPLWARSLCVENFPTSFPKDGPARVTKLKKIHSALAAQHAQGGGPKNWQLPLDLVADELEYFETGLEDSLKQLGRLENNPFAALMMEFKFLRAEKSLSYKRYVELAARVTLAHEILCCRSWTDRHTERLIGAVRGFHNLSFVEDLQLDRILEAAREGFFYFPTGMNLGYYDFNRLWSTPLFPVGVRRIKEIADGGHKSPLHFWNHDFFHALNSWLYQVYGRIDSQGMARLEEFAEKFFTRLEAQANYFTDRNTNRSLEGLAFYGLHENSFRKLANFPLDPFQYLKRILGNDFNLILHRFNNRLDFGAALESPVSEEYLSARAKDVQALID